jgi:hypothetical protein
VDRVLGPMHLIAQRNLKKHRRRLPAGDNLQPIWSYDHAGHHDTADVNERLARIGITQQDSSRCPLPPVSPDFHRVIEHVHAIVCGAFNKKLRTLKGKRTAKYYQRVFKRTFHSVIKASTIQKDILGLPELWTTVSASKADGGTEGDWAPQDML